MFLMFQLSIISIGLSRYNVTFKPMFQFWYEFGSAIAFVALEYQTYLYKKSAQSMNLNNFNIKKHLYSGIFAPFEAENASSQSFV